MINAGIKIPGTQPDMSWNSTTKEWEQIIIEVVYLQPQTSTDNPVSVGDILIDQDPRVFEVVSASHHVGNKFKVNVRCISEDPSIQAVPMMNTQRGLICTPNAQGYIAPYWDGTVVELSPFRMSMIYNFNINQTGGGGSTGGGASTMLQLTDTPSTYGLSGSSLVVNPTRNGFEYKIITGGTSGGTTTETHSITINVGNNGTVFPSGTFEIHNGANLNLQISPDSGYEIDKLIVGGRTVTPTGSYTITNIVEDTLVSISFKAESGSTNPTTSKFGLVDISKTNQIAMGYNHVLALSTDGKLHVSGDNTFGQLGFGSTTSLKLYGIGVSSLEVLSFVPPTTFHQVFAGYNSSAAIDVNGNAYVWGENNFKKFGMSLEDNIKSPVKLNLPFTCRQILIGPSYSVIIGTDNKMYFCGYYGAHTQDIRFDNFTEIIVPGNVYNASCSNSMILVEGNFSINSVTKYLLKFNLNSPEFDQSNLSRYDPVIDTAQTYLEKRIGSIPMDIVKYTNNTIFDDPRDDFYIAHLSPSILFYSGSYPPPPGKVGGQTFIVYDSLKDTSGKRITKFSVGEGLVLILLDQPNSLLSDTFSGRVYVGLSRVDVETNSRGGIIPLSVNGETGGYLRVNGSYIENIKNVISYYNRGIIVRSNGAMQMIYKKSLFEGFTMSYIT